MINCKAKLLSGFSFRKIYEDTKKVDISLEKFREYLFIPENITKRVITEYVISTNISKIIDLLNKGYIITSSSSIYNCRTSCQIIMSKEIDIAEINAEYQESEQSLFNDYKFWYEKRINGEKEINELIEKAKAFTKEKEEIHNQLMKTELYIQYKIACKNEKDLYYKIEEIKKSIKKV
jgi:uncharacterized protein YfcZ (UPF0381/DUF406 family)